MREAIETRLERLRSEHARAEEKLAELRRFQQVLEESLLRLTGAIAALEDCLSDPLLGEVAEPTANGERTADVVQR